MPNASHGYKARHEKVQFEKVCKKGAFEADFEVFWAQKEVGEALAHRFAAPLALACKSHTHSLMHATIARTHATHAAGEEHKGIPKHQGTLLDRRSQFTANNTTRNFKYFGILIPQNSQLKQTGQVHVQSTLVRKLTTRRLLAPDVLSSCLRRLRYSFDALAARFPR